MAEVFDPYYAWLGIPPVDQPADHYALLGVRQFESNPNVISNLTDQRMAHVKTFQTGRHAADSQKLLNEIAAARVCLLNPEKRAPYDARLRAQIARKTAVVAPPLPVAAVIVPPPPAGPPASTPTSDSVSNAFAFIAASDRPMAAAGDLAVKQAIAAQAKRRARARLLFTLAPILGIAAVVVATLIRQSWDADDDAAHPKPNAVATTQTSDAQKSDAANAFSSSGKPPATKPQTDATPDGATGQSNPSTREPTPPSSTAEPIRSTTDSASTPPPAPDASRASPPSTGPSGDAGGAAAAAVPAPAADARQLVYLDDLPEQDVRVDYGTLGKHGSSGYPDTDPVQQVLLNGQEVKHALSTHPPPGSSAHVTYELNGKYESFKAVAAIFDRQSSLTPSPLQFRVLGDSKLLWSSTRVLQEPGDREECNISVDGVMVLTLEVFCAGTHQNAHAAWIDPVVSTHAPRISGVEQAGIGPNSAAPAAAAPTSAPSNGQFPFGQWVDVLRLVDTNSKMVIAGKWSRDGSEVTVERGDHPRIYIPVTIKGGYDLEVDFTRNSGTEVDTLISIGSRPCAAVLDGWGGEISGLCLVGGYQPSDPRNPTSLRRPNPENGRRYLLLVSVRVDSDDHASVEVSLDGKPYLRSWAGDPATLGAAWNLTMPNSSALGLGAHQCGVTFHSARLKMISGSASLDSALIPSNHSPAVAPAVAAPADPAHPPATRAPGKQDAAASSATGAMAFNPEPYALRGHTSKVRFLTFSPDGSRLVSASNGIHDLQPGSDNTLRVWQLDPPQQIQAFTIDKGWFGPQGIAVSPDSRYVAVSAGWDWGSATTGPTVEIFDASGLKHKFNPSGRWAMRAVAFSKDGTALYAARGGKKVHEWSLRNGAETAVTERTSANDHEMPFANLFMPDGDRIVSGDWSGVIRMWDRKTGEQIREYQGHQKNLTALAISPDGTTLVSAAEDNSVRLWNADSGKELLALTGLDVLVKSVAIGPDKTWFVTGENDGAVRIRDTATGKQRMALPGGSAPMISVAISPNGKMIGAGGEDGSILLWTISGGRQRPRINAKRNTP